MTDRPRPGAEPRSSARAHRAVIVYNPVKVDLAALEDAVDRTRGDWEVRWVATSESDPGHGPTREAIETGASLVIAAGGDGTVRAVAEILAGSDVDLGLLPSGTGNLLARNLHLTLDDVPASLRAVFGDSTRNIDIARIEIRRPDDSIDRHAFVVMAGAGLDAQIMSNTDPELKKRVGWFAYAHALVKVSRERHGLRLRYRLDDDGVRGARAQGIIVGNCGSLPANILLLPDAVVDDGLMDLVVLKPESVRGWIALGVKILWENGVVRRSRFADRVGQIQTTSLDMRQGRELVVRLSRPEIVELDGDPLGEAIGFRVRIDPGVLRVKVPA